MHQLRPWITRHQERPPLRRIALGACAAALTIAVLDLLTGGTESLLLAASFGSSCVLVYTRPQSLMAQPANVVGGHVTGTLVALPIAAITPPTWWSTAVAVGAALAVMALLRVTHPPAGATVITVIATDPTWSYVLSPILIGAVFVVAVASAMLRLDGVEYPTATPAEVR